MNCMYFRSALPDDKIRIEKKSAAREFCLNLNRAIKIKLFTVKWVEVKE